MDLITGQCMAGQRSLLSRRNYLSIDYRTHNASSLLFFFFFFMGGDFSDISDELALIPFFKFRSRMDAMDDRPRWGNSDIAGYVKLIGERFRGC